ncbi:MAG: fluoride efflux transporter CrcB [Mangrovibacterium sp.]
MKELVIVFLGSGLGGALRYGFGRVVGRFYQAQFPLSTFLINILACFILGLCVGYIGHRANFSPTLKLFLTVGFCGGFSTFSTFSTEMLMLFLKGNGTMSVLYLVGSVALGLLATYVGFLFAEHL